MVQIGYALSSEEHPAKDLVQHARRAEEVGFSYAMISDHYHPWIENQGQSAFVWSVLGGIAEATSQLRVGTGVTCPIVRYHPAIIAQAAATVASMMPGRFMLGVGTGENLNEHIVGARWPSAAVRLEMLEEAVEVIRMLWQGGMHSHRGRYFTVENACVYSRPSEPPPIIVAASGPRSAELAGRVGDGLINFAPEKQVVERFQASGGAGKPRYIQYNVCWHENEAAARKIALETVPTVALPGELGQELPLPRHFEQAARMVREEDMAEAVVCGPDPQKHIEGIQQRVDAGFDHIHVDQIGPDQEGFFRFYEREVLPVFRSKAVSTSGR